MKPRNAVTRRGFLAAGTLGAGGSAREAALAASSYSVLETVDVLSDEACEKLSLKRE